VVVKFVSDSCGLVHFRHPYEVGGAYWTASVAWGTLILPQIAARFYPEDGPIDRDTLINLALVLSLLWTFVFAVFLMTIKKKYYVTFWDTTSGKAQIEKKFFSYMGSNTVAMDEAAVGVICTVQRTLWEHFEEEAKQFVMSNWEEWEKQDYEWFRKSTKASKERGLAAKIRLDNVTTDKVSSQGYSGNEGEISGREG
jgi:H+/gluconate symporter-like permease